MDFVRSKFLNQQHGYLSEHQTWTRACIFLHISRFLYDLNALFSTRIPLFCYQFIVTDIFFIFSIWFFPSLVQINSFIFFLELFLFHFQNSIFFVFVYAALWLQEAFNGTLFPANELQMLEARFFPFSRFCFIPGRREAVLMAVSWRRRLHSGALASYPRPSRANPLDCGNSSALPKVTSAPGTERRPVRAEKEDLILAHVLTSHIREN